MSRNTKQDHQTLGEEPDEQAYDNQENEQPHNNEHDGHAYHVEVPYRNKELTDSQRQSIFEDLLRSNSAAHISNGST